MNDERACAQAASEQAERALSADGQALMIGAPLGLGLGAAALSRTGLLPHIPLSLPVATAIVAGLLLLYQIADGTLDRAERRAAKG
ncbi:MAG: hypothetical protein Q4D31_07470 [Eubacteriales bacterium]|nr:hypothetical protein [Eubacteriales bacterium]